MDNSNKNKLNYNPNINKNLYYNTLKKNMADRDAQTANNEENFENENNVEIENLDDDYSNDSNIKLNDNYQANNLENNYSESHPKLNDNYEEPREPINNEENSTTEANIKFSAKKNANFEEISEPLGNNENPDIPDDSGNDVIPQKSIYDLVIDFKKNHRGGIAWRIKRHCEVIEKHLNPGEIVLFAFAGQKNIEVYDIFSTCVVALTNKRLVLAQKRVIWGYVFSSITPDLYNDLQVRQSLLFGRLTVDTVKEVINISNLPKSGLDEIETNITEFMMKEKQKYKTIGSD